MAATAAPSRATPEEAATLVNWWTGRMKVRARKRSENIQFFGRLGISVISIAATGGC